MANTSRNPFAPPPVPMKRRKLSKEAGALVPTAAVAVPATRTQKKKNTATTSAKQNLHLSDIDEESICSRKPPPEHMPSYVPYFKRNTPRVTRPVATPPTLLYVPSLPPIEGNDCNPHDNPLDHHSPHKDPPVEFVEKVARAADTSNATDDNDEEEDEEEEERFTDLLGEKTSGLDDLCYSDDDEDYDDEEYDDGMDEEAHRIEYSDRNYVLHGRCQTNFIPGGPRPPVYDGMSKEEMKKAKTEFKKLRKKYTDCL